MSITDTCWTDRDYRLADRVGGGDTATVVGLPEATMRRAVGRTTEPDTTAPEIPFTATFVPAGSGVAARWQFSLAAAVTATLAPGTYVFATRYTLTGGAVQAGPTTLVQVRNAP